MAYEGEGLGMILKIIFFVLLAIGLLLISSDIFKIPYIKASRAVKKLLLKTKNKQSSADLRLSDLSQKLSKIIRLDEYKRISLENDLASADISLTPEQFKADALVKAAVAGIAALPFAFVFPLLCPVFLIAAVIIYTGEGRKLTKKLKKRREKIEYSLPGLANAAEKNLKHTRDVLYIMESYSENTEKELSDELKKTAADMRSGGYETAITRLETRVGSPMMSDICRGFLGVIRGDDMRMYFSSLSLKLSDVRRERLKAEAKKAPKRVKKLSVALLVCFILMYMTVIVCQISQSLSLLFGG